MAVDVFPKPRLLIFHTRGKQLNNNIKILYDDSEPGQFNPALTYS
jgi:hypothetical protein